ncbi:hypothetical protein Tco_0783777 [Tanacetum coccineum]
MTLSGFGKDEIIRILAWRPIALAAMASELKGLRNFSVVSLLMLLSRLPTLAYVFAQEASISIALRNLNGTLSIAFIIRNVEIFLRLKEFARILRVACQGVCVSIPDWPISSLPNGVDSNPDIYPPPHEDFVLIRDSIFYKRPPEEEENDPVNNYTLDPIPYIDQLPPIEGGESLEFKQTKGMFKCFGHFLSNLGKKK